GFAAVTAVRGYIKANGDNLEVQITADAAIITQVAPLFANANAVGAQAKIVTIGSHRAMVNEDGDIHMIVDNRYLVSVAGSGSGIDKMAYLRAVEIGRASC